MAIDYFEDEDKAPEGATLEQLREYADDITLLQDEIDKDTRELAIKTEKLKKLTQKTVPDIMNELQIKSFKLLDGSELSVEDKVQASIPAHKKAEAFAWLEKYHFDGIIKTSVSVSFGKGEMEKAKEAQKILAEKGVVAEIDRSIHPSTLSSFVKERLAAAGEAEQSQGEPVVDINDGFDDEDGAEKEEKIPNLPQDIFSVFEFKQCKIKVAKKKK
ncbi:gp33 family protein [Citrobacter sp.]|uniref:gp33 family protein n=1 Tax=Citrobacter sp. TaxID=1896336 RepID=UPI002FC92C6C